MDNYKSGFITIIGRPNAGKSTLVNQLLKQKIMITSDKPQTTRNTIQGIYTKDKVQMIFIDTPGIHKSKHKLGKYMNEEALNALKQVDLVLYIVSGDEAFGTGEEYIIEHLKATSQPVFLLINKTDKMTKEAIYNQINKYKDLYPFAEIIPISALKNKNTEELIKVLTDYLPEGPQYYPEDVITDHPEQFVIAELIREKVLYKTRDEVPHSVAVIIDRFEQREGKSIYDISATIIVERESQKPIIIGKGGAMLKEIGTLARVDIENFLGSKVYLELYVKVVDDWRNSERILSQIGVRENR